MSAVKPLAPVGLLSMGPRVFAALPTMLGSAFLWGIIHVVVQAVLQHFISTNAIRSKFLASKKPEQMFRTVSDVAHRFPSIVHAIYVSQGCFRLLFTEPEPALYADPIYGYSPLAEHYYMVACGYFLYETVIHIALKFDFLFHVHGIVCFSVYFFSLAPFLHYYGLFFLLYEASGPLFNARKLMIFFGCTNTILFDLTSYAFALVFFVIRLVIGIPVSIYWWGEMLGLLASGRAHSVFVVVVYLIANTAMSCLNVMWMSELIRVARRSGNDPTLDAHSKPRHSKVPAGSPRTT